MIKVLELFGGIGAPRQALENLKVNYKIIDYVEWWPWAVKAYNQMFENNYQTQDVRDWNLNVDLLFHGSPCQDWSNAGTRDLTKGRSLLYLRTLEIIEKELHPRPKYIVWENVPSLISKKFNSYFQYYLDKLVELGYNNYWKILNAKDFGLPQSRKRVFVVSIRKDIKQEFNWNNLETKTMKPLLDFININERNPSYFIKAPSLIKGIELGKIKIINDVVGCITVKQERWYNSAALAFPLDINHLANGKIKIANLTSFNSDNYVTLASKTDAVIKTLQGNSRCKIAVPIKNDYLEVKESQAFNNYLVLPRNSDGQVINGAWNRYWKINCPSSYLGTVAGTNPLKLAIPILAVNQDFDYRLSDRAKRPIGVINKEGKVTIPITNNDTANKFGISIVPTITTSGTTKVAIPAINPIPGIPIFIIDGELYHLRILTERESFLLQGFPIETFLKIKDISKTNLYTMAGNTIPVPVLEELFIELLQLRKKK